VLHSVSYSLISIETTYPGLHTIQPRSHITLSRLRWFINEIHHNRFIYHELVCFLFQKIHDLSNQLIERPMISSYIESMFGCYCKLMLSLLIIDGTVHPRSKIGRYRFYSAFIQSYHMKLLW